MANTTASGFALDVPQGPTSKTRRDKQFFECLPPPSSSSHTPRATSTAPLRHPHLNSPKPCSSFGPLSSEIETARSSRAFPSARARSARVPVSAVILGFEGGRGTGGTGRGARVAASTSTLFFLSPFFLFTYVSSDPYDSHLPSLQDQGGTAVGSTFSENQSPSKAYVRRDTEIDRPIDGSIGPSVGSSVGLSDENTSVCSRLEKKFKLQGRAMQRKARQVCLEDKPKTVISDGLRGRNRLLA